MKNLLFLLLMNFAVAHLFAQPRRSTTIFICAPSRNTLLNQPLYIIDGKPDTLSELDPNDIASFSILKGFNATVLYGDKGKNGVVIIETKKFARAKCIEFLRAASPQYDSLYQQTGSDTSFQYIFNGKILKQNYEGSMAGLPSRKLLNVRILNKQQLKDNFAIDDKDYGVAIISEKRNVVSDAH